MKPKKNTGNKPGKLPCHLVLSDYTQSTNGEALLKGIIQKYSFLSISVITDNENISLQEKSKQIEVYKSLNAVKNQLSNSKENDNILIISLKNDAEYVFAAINRKLDNDLDVLFFQDNTEKSYLITKNCIFGSVNWLPNNSLEKNLGRFLCDHYIETKKYKIVYEGTSSSRLQSTSDILKLSYFKKLILSARSFLVTPFSYTDIYIKRKDFVFNEPTIFRFLFVISCFVFFFLMPILSFDSGISGDEEKHVDQAQKVYAYFETNGEDTSYLVCPYGPFYAYNITFDVFLHVLIKAFNIENLYEFRHVINAITGFFTVLFCGLLVVYLAGWRAGLISILLLFLSPRFIGHTYNNPKDIPFALCYIFSIYYIVKFIDQLPKISIKHSILVALGIGATLNIRIGGLLLIAYLFLFSGLHVLNSIKLKDLFGRELKYLGRLALVLVVISIVGYAIGIVFWPYGLEDPIKNPMDSLKIMTNFKVSLRQTFEGSFIWSDNVPWYYTLKYILISAPITVLLSMFVTFIVLKPLAKRYGWLNIFMLIFSFVFPLIYIIYKKSNVYGGWRHMIFAYVFMVCFASIGINYLFLRFKNKYIKYSIVALLLLLHFHPIKHIIKNHPYQYIYFNQFAGGANGAFGNYEMDYYYHSLKEGSEWLAKNYIKKDTSQNVIVATNHSVLTSYYLRNVKNAKVVYVRYYDRGNYDWDYAIIANSYINSQQQKLKTWPPVNTIHTIDVDDAPVCAILKRDQKFDLEGYKKLKAKNYFGAIQDLNKAIELEKTNEVAYINLATAYMYIRQFDLARKTIHRLLEIYPKYDKGLNILGLTYFHQKKYEDAYKIFTSITELNPKFVSAYHNLGLVFLRMDKKDDALKYFQQAIKTNRKYKPPYLAIARILQEQGRKEEAQKFIDAANKLK